MDVSHPPPLPAPQDNTATLRLVGHGVGPVGPTRQASFAYNQAIQMQEVNDA